jgi:hypothetical protein
MPFPILTLAPATIVIVSTVIIILIAIILPTMIVVATIVVLIVVAAVVIVRIVITTTAFSINAVVTAWPAVVVEGIVITKEQGATALRLDLVQAASLN